jgi:hypothetical protein
VKVRQLRDYSNVVLKDKVKEIKTFVTTDCLIVMFFPFGFRILSHFSCAVPARFSHFDKLVYRFKIKSLRLSASTDPTRLNSTQLN